MTREAFEKLPPVAQRTIENTREDIKDNPATRMFYLAKGRAYLAGLRDAGLITEAERKALFCYLTV